MQNQKCEKFWTQPEQIIYYTVSTDTTPVKTVDFSYDPSGNLTGYDDGITSARYEYDQAGRKVSATVDFGAFEKTCSYTYLKNSAKKSFTAPDSTTYTYQYDNNRLTGVEIPDTGLITINEYTWNRPASMTLPGGFNRSYEYDPLMRIKQITAKDPADNDILNYQYDYDRMDNITDKITEHGDYGYDYDDIYRLTNADNPETPELADESFTYDSVGNRLTSADTSGTWDYNRNNELLGYNDIDYEYDANGSMTKKIAGNDVTTYVYNTEDRLTEVWDGEPGTGSLTAAYYYDPFGRRLWKEVNGIRTYYMYADEGLIAEINPSGSVTKSYGWQPGSTWGTDPLFMAEGSDEDGSLNYYFYQNDHLGTPQKMTDPSGAVMWSATYSSFGKAHVDPGSTVTNNLRFPGQYEDTEAGMHYNWFRYYRPSSGRYPRTDPIRFKGMMNRFVYIFNNPVNLIDPWGLWSFTYNAGGHAPTGPWPVAGGGTMSSELVNPLDASGRLEARGVTPEATAGVWSDIGVSAGIGDLSDTGDQAGAIIGIGSGRYGGVQLILRKEFDPSKGWYNPLKYIDGVSVGLGIGLGFPVTLSSPMESELCKD